MKKIGLALLIIIVVILAIVVVGLILFLVLKPSSKRCGDGICGPMEKAKGTCLQDCPVSNDGNNQNDIPYYFIAVHLNPVRVENLDSEMAGDYNRGKQMINYATQHNITLSLMFSAPWAEYISKSPERMAELEKWKQAGHEIGMHHHDIYHKGSWDGYTEASLEEADRARRTLGEVPRKPSQPPENYVGTLDEFMTIMKKINPNMNSGVANELEDKRTMPDELLYSAASGYLNFGEPKVMWDGMNDPNRAINNYVYVSKINGITRKWLGYAHVMNSEQVESAKDTFNSMNSGQVFGAVMHTSEEEKDALFSLIDFLSSKDPTRGKSVVQAKIIKSGILTEVEIEFSVCGDNDCGDYETEITCPEDC